MLKLTEDERSNKHGVRRWTGYAMWVALYIGDEKHTAESARQAESTTWEYHLRSGILLIDWARGK